MAYTKEEKGLLAKLASGLLDGMVGDEKVYHGYKDVYRCTCVGLFPSSFAIISLTVVPLNFCPFWSEVKSSLFP